MFKKCLGVAVLIFVLVGPALPVFAQSGVAQGLAISPSILEVEAESGKSYDLEYVVENGLGVDNLAVDVTKETFQEGSIPGSANIIPFTADNDTSFWLTVPSEQLYKRGEKRKNTYTLTVPDEVRPGAYLFAIVYQPRVNDTQSVGGSGQVILRSRIATLLFVNVGGDISKQPSINNFTVGNYWVDPFFDTVSMTYQVQVKGNSFYRPTGNIFLEQTDSETITTLSSITSDRLILPNGKRDYKYCLQGGVFANKCSQEEKLDGSAPLFGERQLALRLDFTDGSGQPQSVVAQKPVFFIPYKLSLAIIGFFLLWLALYYTIRFVKNRAYVRPETE